MTSEPGATEVAEAATEQAEFPVPASLDPRRSLWECGSGMTALGTTMDGTGVQAILDPPGSPPSCSEHARSAEVSTPWAPISPAPVPRRLGVAGEVQFRITDRMGKYTYSSSCRADYGSVPEEPRLGLEQCLRWVLPVWSE
jgi:hypothetical protein